MRISKDDFEDFVSGTDDTQSLSLQSSKTTTMVVGLIITNLVACLLLYVLLWVI